MYGQDEEKMGMAGGSKKPMSTEAMGAMAGAGKKMGGGMDANMKKQAIQRKMKKMMY